jgi:hypothetical protein
MKTVGLSLYPTAFQRTKQYFDKSTTHVNDPGPLEFLPYLEKATVIVTNSYQGAVLSIKSKKEIFVATPEYSTKSVLDMLDLYRLSNRLKKADKLPSKNDIKIDCSIIEPIFENENNRSTIIIKLLLNSL